MATGLWSLLHEFDTFWEKTKKYLTENKKNKH